MKQDEARAKEKENINIFWIFLGYKLKTRTLNVLIYFQNM